MYRRSILCVLVFLVINSSVFSQASVIRDYVGLITQSFHPDVVKYMKQLQNDLQKRNYNEAVKSVDNYLKGETGTGFVYVAKNGTNYIITNFHVISHAEISGLSVSFEKPDGEKTRFSNLSIVAADEDLDIAILAFQDNYKPFKQGLSFLTRPVQEGDDVYSAGFPLLVNSMVWQLGRGMVSNASVRLPDKEDDSKTIGPFIQHTAQVDPGNSGGPLLIQMQGVPSGYAVAGINTLSARYRQGANFSIPINQLQTFLDKKLNTKPEQSALEARIDTFIEGLSVPKAVYQHIAKYLSNTCTAENFEYAESELFERAPRTIQEKVVQAFISSPVTGMSYAVAWIIEDSMRSKSGKITIEKESVTPVDDYNYTVKFKVNDKIVSSEWTNEYGIWRIKSFGSIASGDKRLIKKKAEQKQIDENLRASPKFQLSAGMTYIFNQGAGFGADIIFRGSYTGFGLRMDIAKDFLQIDCFWGLYIPIKAEKIAFTPFGSIGLGYQSIKLVPAFDKVGYIGFPVHGGLQFTTATVPGLYLQVAYQHNFMVNFLEIVERNTPYKNLIFISVGYSFEKR